MIAAVFLLPVKPVVAFIAVLFVVIIFVGVLFPVESVVVVGRIAILFGILTAKMMMG